MLPSPSAFAYYSKVGLRESARDEVHIWPVAMSDSGFL